MNPAPPAPARSRWSFPLGRLFGIAVRVHVTFVLLLAFVGVAYGLQGGPAAALGGVAFFALLFLCVLSHEFGHALAARQFGIRTRDITLLPIGGLARLERLPERPAQELWVALAGPLVNVVIAGGLLAGLALSGRSPGTDWAIMGGSLAERLLAANVFLVGFNLLPAFPMDGGRVLRSLLAMQMPFARATRIAARIGQGMAVVFGFVGLFLNPLLILIALFVWVGAAQEAAAAEWKASFAGAPVRAAMLTDFRTLAPDDRLGDVARLLLAGSQRDFPVLEDGRLVGMLCHQDCFAALQQGGETVPVRAIMRTDFRVVSPDQPLETALAESAENALPVRPVMVQGRLMGLLTAENVGEFVMIRRALARRPAAAAPVPPAPAVPPVIGRPAVPGYAGPLPPVISGAGWRGHA